MTAENEPDITPVNLAVLFEGVDGTFAIPPYQRLYEWEESDAEALFDDLLEFSSTDAGYYILGQIIVSRNGNSSDYRWSIVDGQQRLTTIYLLSYALLSRIRDFAESAIAGNPAFTAKRALESIMYSVDNAAGGPERIRLLVSEIGREYVDIILDDQKLDNVVDLNDTQKNLRQNFELFQSLAVSKFDSLDSLVLFVNRFLYSVFIIRTRIGSTHQALEMFEKINSRGRPLNSAALLKNLMFEYVDESQYSQLSKTWDAAVQDVFLIRPNRAASMQFLMKSLLGVRTGESISNKDVFSRWRELFKSEDIAVPDFERELSSSAAFLRDLSKGAQSRFNLHLNGTRFFGTVQHLPLMLSIQHLKNAPEIFNAAKRVIDARIVLSLFALEKPQTLESKIWKWAKALSELTTTSTRAQLAKACEKALEETETLFETALTHFQNLKYTSKRDQKRIRFVLAACEDHLSRVIAKENDVDGLFSGLLFPPARVRYHLDHIYPKSLADSPDFEFSQGVEWVNQIGNLVLLHPDDNRNAGAARPLLKSDDYASSKLLLTRVLATDASLAGINARLRNAISQARNQGMEPVSASWNGTQANQNTVGYWALFSAWLRTQLDATEN